jgi:NADH-quinone oxidoreductase subunit A
MEMLTDFGKILVFIILAAIFVTIAFTINRFLRPVRPTTEKLMTYECGENPIGTPWIKFNVRFYVVALIFLLFDVEITLLIPWAVVYKEFGFYGFFIGILFLFILMLGMLYEWKKGDLDWVRPHVKPNDLKTIMSEFENQYGTK